MFLTTTVTKCMSLFFGLLDAKSRKIWIKLLFKGIQEVFLYTQLQLTSSGRNIAFLWNYFSPYGYFYVRWSEPMRQIGPIYWYTYTQLLMAYPIYQSCIAAAKKWIQPHNSGFLLSEWCSTPPPPNVAALVPKLPIVSFYDTYRHLFIQLDHHMKVTRHR